MFSVVSNAPFNDLKLISDAGRMHPKTWRLGLSLQDLNTIFSKYWVFNAGWDTLCLLLLIIIFHVYFVQPYNQIEGCTDFV